MLKPFIDKVINKQDLTRAESESAMDIIMTGEATPAQIGAYLIALRMKGETIDEITGAVLGMRKASVKVPVKDRSKPIFDVVGTGGDGAHTFNISTASSFVLAGCDVKVAKHGNRAASSKCGSADVLSALGLNLDLTPDQVGAAIDQIGIGFMFAPKFHPAMKYAIGPRKEIGQRTIFNVLGPLTNPAGADMQLTGVYATELVSPIAQTLKELGSKAAIVLHGAGGTDELNTVGKNQICELRSGNLQEYQLDPVQLDLPIAQMSDLKGADPDGSAEMMRQLLSNKLHGPIRDSVLLNVAAALSLVNGDLKESYRVAESSLSDGSALTKLNELIDYSRSFIHEPIE